MRSLRSAGFMGMTLFAIPTAAEEAQGIAPERAQAEAMAQIRDLSTAMLIWLNGHAPGGPERDSEAEKASYWKSCPSISVAELRALLVPDIIASVPDTDPWGNQYEVCLEREDFSHGGTMGIRCAGQDGTFQTEDYVEGPFEPSELDQDIVLIDGFFMRWPRISG